MGLQFYMAVEGMVQGKFKGGTTRRAHRGRIVIAGFDYEVQSPRDAATGQATGRRQHKPVTIYKEWGPATPQFFQALVTNEVLKSVLIEVFRTAPDGTEELYFTVKLANAAVSDISQYPDAIQMGTGQATNELEAVSFIFHKIELENKADHTSAADDWQTASV